MADKKKVTKTATKTPATKAKTTAKTPAKVKGSKAKAAPVALEATTKAAVAEAVAPAANIPWRRIDLHLHTPASHDYETPEHGYIGILQQAEKRGLSMIAFTDHNTVNGYKNLRREIADLEMLEKLARIQPAELGKLNEYRRLLEKVVVLPGFEFTATFGFHILGIFPPDKPIRDIEHVLLQLKVPGNVIDDGLTEAGATSDVLTAYRTIAEAGGLAIAAHANSTSGVSMRDMDFGGQTRIAFTQDSNLTAIEWTDLDRGRRSSANLLTGIRNEYPRRMHALQGSDAHRITVNPANPKRLGVGERATDVQLETVSFASLRELLQSQHWERVRPSFDLPDIAPDHSKSQREQGASATQAFHPVLGKKATDKWDAVLRDIVAMANSQGGTVWVGCEADSKRKAAGIKGTGDAMMQLGDLLQTRVHPNLVAESTAIKEGAVEVIRITLKPGTHAPYVLDETVYLIRDGATSRAAKRDEIVHMARRHVPHDGTRPSHNAPQVQPRSQHAPERGHDAHGRDQRRDASTRQPDPRRDIGRRSESRPQEPRRDDGRRDQPDRRPLQPRAQEQRPPAPAATSAPAAEPIKASTPEPMRPPAAPPVTVTDIDGTTSVKTVAQTQPAQTRPAPAPAPAPRAQAQPAAASSGNGDAVQMPPPHPALPKSGVEVLAMEQRDGKVVFALRDSRNNGITRNVTFSSARDLWHYAITMHNRNTYPADKIVWSGDRSVLSSNERAGKIRYDVAVRMPDGSARVIYGVTHEGADDEWRDLLTAASTNS